MQPILGVIADDLTGGMETAAMLVALGVDCGFVTRPALVKEILHRRRRSSSLRRRGSSRPRMRFVALRRRLRRSSRQARGDCSSNIAQRST